MEEWHPVWSYVPITYGKELGTLERVIQRTRITNNLNGSALKVKFSNVGCDNLLLMESVTIRTVDRETGKLTGEAPVTLRHKRVIQILPNEEDWSDPVEMPVKMWEDIEVLVNFTMPNSPMTVCTTTCTDLWHSSLHYGLRKRAWDKYLPELVKEEHVLDTGIAAGICAVAARTKPGLLEVAFFGDSITHMGYYTTPLTQRMYQDMAGEVTTMNVGVGGNRLLSDAPCVRGDPFGGVQYGKSGLKRMEHDLYADFCPDVVLFLEGVNDCNHCFDYHEDYIPTKDDMRAGIIEFSRRAKAHGSRVILSTVLPYDNRVAPYWEKAEIMRQAMNDVIRHLEGYCVVVDMEDIMRQPGKIRALREGMHVGDGLHPNSVGGKRMAKMYYPTVWRVLNQLAYERDNL